MHAYRVIILTFYFTFIENLIFQIKNQIKIAILHKFRAKLLKFNYFILKKAVLTRKIQEGRAVLRKL